MFKIAQIHIDSFDGKIASTGANINGLVHIFDAKIAKTEEMKVQSSRLVPEAHVNLQ